MPSRKVKAQGAFPAVLEAMVTYTYTYIYIYIYIFICKYITIDINIYIFLKRARDTTWIKLRIFNWICWIKTYKYFWFAFVYLFLGGISRKGVGYFNSQNHCIYFPKQANFKFTKIKQDKYSWMMTLF